MLNFSQKTFLNSKRLTITAAILLLTAMLLVAFFSMLRDSLTFDELAHIPAGYSYLTKNDYRINPEHPPLIKDIAAFPLLFQSLNFPDNHYTWTQNDSAPPWWIQFDLGTEFIYRSGNEPGSIIVWSRLPMIIILITLGGFLFFFARQIGGIYVGLMALLLYSFSPTFIAHGRLVTTDVAAALGAILATYFWLRFLRMPTLFTVTYAGIAFGIALLFKFSLVLLVPFFVFLTIVYACVSFGASRMKNLVKYATLALIAGIIGIVFIVWPVYQWHIAQYPLERNLRDTSADLMSHPIPFTRDITLWMTEQPLLRPLAQYARGVLMASQRTIFGNTVYLLGKISGSGWWYYFPIVYFFKLPLALHILSVIVSGMLIWRFLRQRTNFLILFRNSAKWIRNNFAVFAFFIWLTIYWAAAIFGNLNIGVRHLLPTLPFVYLLLALGIKRVYSDLGTSSARKILWVIVGMLFLWYIGSSLGAFPHYLSYYNELGGGKNEGYKIAVDSNYDWGQDFYELVSFVEVNNIDEIYVDYFGGENPSYWLGKKYKKLEPRQITEPPSGWIAVSVNQLVGGVAEPVFGFDQPSGYYKWLEEYGPVARVGTSIFIYYVD